MMNESSVPSEINTVLVVDDHRPAALMLKRLFENYGYQVDCVYSGEEAIAHVKKQSPHLIILDVMMPGLNGYEVLEILRSDPHTNEIPTILATAKDTPEDIEHGLQLGANDYVPKPIKPRELLARARNQIEASRLRKTLKRRTTDLEVLLRISEELNTRLNVDELIQLFVVLVLDLLPVTKTQVGLFNTEHVLQKGVRISVDTDLELFFNADRQILARLVEERAPIQIIVDNAIQIFVLLSHDEDGYGVLTMTSHVELDDAYLRLLEAIARQGTLALRNAILYDTNVAYANHLEDMVDDRTRALKKTQNQLIQSEKLASVGRLAAGIAHEINNPLTPIQLILEGMNEDIEYGDAIRVEDIQQILESVIRIKVIVERLQQFTRNRQTVEPVLDIIKLSDIIDNVMALTHKILEQQKVTLSINIDHEITIYGNRDQLSQVLLNLILNANAAIKENGRIEIELYQKEQHAYLGVQDNGMGIPDANISKIFEPFMTTKDDGSGLGLFISYEIVHNHNGEIHVESEVGKGTKFTIVLPLAN